MSKSKLPPADTTAKYPDTLTDVTIPKDPFPKETGFGPEDTSRNAAKENADPKGFTSGTAALANDIDASKLDPNLLASPATGGPVTAPTGTPPQAAEGTNLDVLDKSKTDAGSVLDRIVAEHAALTTPEVHKTALRKADEAREHGAPAMGTPSDLLSPDGGPRPILADGAEQYESYHEVTVKLGSPQESDYVAEGMVVSHVNSASGEVSFRVEAGTPAFTSVRARQVVKR